MPRVETAQTAKVEWKQYANCGDVISGALYDISAVRILFPFDFGSLSSFHPGHSAPSNIDPFVVMIERAGKELGIQLFVHALFSEVDMIWKHLENPPPIDLPASAWTDETDGGNA